MDKIAIILTTFLRDELLYTCIDSFVKYKTDNMILIIVDQGEKTKEKIKYLIEKATTCQICYITLPFDSGLSKARNIGVEKAAELGCKYCILSADSIVFNNTIQNVNTFINGGSFTFFDIIGFNLFNRKFAWEAKLKLIPEKCFQLTFIEKKYTNCYLIDNGLPLWKCDIIRNFFIAKTELLYKVKWDENLLAAEHEDFFYRIKENNGSVGWTDSISGDYIGTREGKYNEYRQKNWRIGQQRLKEKYQIKGWVSYQNEQFMRIP